MSWLVCLVALTASAAGTASINGYVLDTAGKPVAGANVFAENVDAGQLLTTRTGADGMFTFNNVAPGLTGLFAHAPGHAFGGLTVPLTPGQSLRNQQIALGKPATLSGRISGYKAKALEGAQILRVALLGDQKVSIPFDKLEPHGVSMPVSQDKGRFEIRDLPEGVPIALKIGHRDYPVQAIAEVVAGDANAKVELMPGVTVTGNTLIRGQDRAVAHVDILVRNAQPPYETTATRSDNNGRFHVSLKPGMYTFQASAVSYRSAGMQRVAVTGESMEQRVNVFMMPTGTIVGTVRNAETDAPVPGAKLVLESSGNPAGVAYTDANGNYRFTGASGVNKVYLADLPGYRAGGTRSMEVSVPGEGEFEMPVFWVMPLGANSIRVIDANGGPIPGAIVTLLSPSTLGWRFADAAGNASLVVGALPDDGRIAGIAEHPSGAMAGLFALGDTGTDDRVVQVFPVGSVRGRVMDAKGQGVSGIVVAGRLVDAAGRPSLVLWQAISRPDGGFEWTGVVPYAQQQCYAFGADGEVAVGASFTIEPGGHFDAGSAEVAVRPGASAYRRPMNWLELPRISGVAPETPHPAVLFHVPPSETALIVDALELTEPILRSFGYRVAVVVDGSHAPLESRLPVVQGVAPGTAATYITDTAGNVVLETFGLPPVSALAR